VEHSSQIALLGTRDALTRLSLLLQRNYLSYVLCCKGIFSSLHFAIAIALPCDNDDDDQDDAGDVRRLMRSATDGDRDKSESTSTAVTKDREHSILTPRFFLYILRVIDRPAYATSRATAIDVCSSFA